MIGGSYPALRHARSIRNRAAASAVTRDRSPVCATAAGIAEADGFRTVAEFSSASASASSTTASSRPEVERQPRLLVSASVFVGV